jgi:cellulose biosynthesis protein BcsQ
MRIVCLSNERNSLGTTTMIVGLAGALGEQGQHVLVLDPDPRATLVRKATELPTLGHSLMHAFTDEHLPYEHVLFHCPSSFRGLAMSALAAADLVLLPVSGDPSAPDSLETMLRTVAMIERSRGLVLPVLIVPTAESRSVGADTHGGCGHCIVWDEHVPAGTTPIAAKAALERLAAWLLNDGTTLVRATQATDRAAA